MVCYCPIELDLGMVIVESKKVYRYWLERPNEIHSYICVNIDIDIDIKLDVYLVNMYMKQTHSIRYEGYIYRLFRERKVILITFKYRRNRCTRVT